MVTGSMNRETIFLATALSVRGAAVGFVNPKRWRASSVLIIDIFQLTCRQIGQGIAQVYYQQLEYWTSVHLMVLIEACRL